MEDEKIIEILLSKISKKYNKNEDVDYSNIFISDASERIYEKYPFDSIPLYNLNDFINESINNDCIREGISDNLHEIWGVDGSSKLVFGNNEMALLFCRIVITNTVKRYFSEFLSFSYLKDNSYYLLEYYPIRGIKLFDDVIIGEYNAYDPNYSFLGKRADPRDISAMLRKYGEWEIIKKVSEIEGEMFILKDGGLHSTIPDETKIINEVINKKNIRVIGFVKNNLLITNRGRNLIDEVYNYVSSFHYDTYIFGSVAKGIKEIHPAKIYVAKFHKASKPYRLDVPFHYNEDKILEMIRRITTQTKDIDFLGYPYVLVKADRDAKVREVDIQRYQRMLFKSQIMAYLQYLSMDTHELLWKV